MSEQISSEAAKPASPANAPQSTDVKEEAPAKPAPPPEPPFTVDELLSCTARFTHKAWYLFYNQRKDMTFIRETPIRATLEAKSTEGAKTLEQLLLEAGVSSISREEKTLFLTATFEVIQKVIKHPETHLLDAVRI